MVMQTLAKKLNKTTEIRILQYSNAMVMQTLTQRQTYTRYIGDGITQLIIG